LQIADNTHMKDSTVLFDELELIVTEDESGDTEGQVRANTEWFQTLQRVTPNLQIVVVCI